MALVRWETSYVGIRMALWFVMWAAIHLDAFIHRASRGRGWRLHRGILVYLTTECLFQIIHFSVVYQYNSDERFNPVESLAFKVEVFVGWIAESVFLFIILLVSAGYCILRENLGENLKKVVAIPTIYGTASMIVDYIILNSSAHQVVTQQSKDDEEIDVEDLTALALLICLIVKATIFITAWIFVFEHLNREIRLLRGEESLEDLPPPPGDESSNYTRPDLQHVADNPERDVDAPQTVADVVTDRAKLQLLTRFRTLLIIYIISMILAILVANILPLYIGHASVEKLQSVISILEDIILFGFTVTLSIIFRPVGDNPYLLLMEDDENGQEAKEVVTELGIISFEPPTPQQSTTAPAESQLTSARFSLGADSQFEGISPRHSNASETPIAATTLSPSWPDTEARKE